MHEGSSQLAIESAEPPLIWQVHVPSDEEDTHRELVTPRATVTQEGHAG